MAATEMMFTCFEDTTANIATALTTRLVETGYAQVLFFNTTLDSLVYIKNVGNAAAYRYPLTLDEDYDSLTQIASLKINDDGWIGLGAGAGRIEFDNQATDEVNFLSCNVGIGIATPDDVKLHVWNATAGAVSAATNTVVAIENSTDCYLNFLTPAANKSGILFGDPGDNDVGRILYDHANDEMSFYTSGSLAMIIDSVGAVGLGVAAAGTPESALEITVNAGGTNKGYITIEELAIVSPGTNPGTNKVALFARDSGGGLTEFCAEFQDGTVIIIASET